MKNTKKLSAILLALVLVLTSFAGAFADQTAAPNGTNADRRTITVQDVEDAAGVTAYQFLTANYVEGKWDGTYVLTAAGEAAAIAAGVLPANPTPAQKAALVEKFSDAATITSDDVAKIAFELKKTPANGTPLVKTANTNNWTADVPVGQYIVLANGTGKYIYNPMVVGAGYGDGALDNPGWTVNGENADNSVSATTEFLAGNAVKAKRAEITANKKQLGSEYLVPATEAQIAAGGTFYDEEGNEWVDGAGTKYVKAPYAVAVDVEGGDDVQLGDVIDFQLEAQIPNYNLDLFKNPWFSISDTLETGKFTDQFTNLQVFVGATVEAAIAKDPVEAADNTYAVTRSGDTITVKLAKDFIAANLGGFVVVKYQATLSEDCDKNFNPNTNSMTVSYSSNPDNQTGVEPQGGDDDILDFTNTHTFKIDFVKTDDNENVDQRLFLGGAVFTLYRDAACTQVVATATSDAGTGAFSFEGLDAGTYYMKETTPPAGYQANDTLYTITIEATYTKETSGSDVVKFDKALTENGTTYYVDANNNKTYTDPDDANNVYGPFLKPTTVHNHNFKIDTLKVSMTSDRENDTNVVIGELGQEHPIRIQNTKTPSLPSTGGIGTYLFTIAGVAILAVAAFMLIFKKKGNTER